MNKKYLALLEQGGTVVTASQRLARHCRHAYALAQVERGRRAWATPDILPWQAWLQRCWDGQAVGTQDRLLLNTSQQRVLWQRVIEASSWSEWLLQPSHAAERVQEAWSLLHQYREELDPHAAGVNEDTRAFRAWAGEFARTCRDSGWCDTDSMIDSLARSTTPSPGADAIALLGFEQLTPQQQSLLAALEAAGCRVDTGLPAARPQTARPAVAAYADSRAEIRAAAAWARSLLERDPAVRIGLIVPDLQARRSELLAAFEDCLVPGLLPGLDDGAAPPFSLSLGRPLIDYPLVACAFTLLSLAEGTLGLAEWGALLRSPYLAGANDEAVQRSGLEARLRDYGEVRPDIGTVLYVGGQRLEEGQRPRRFIKFLAAARDAVQQMPQRGPAGAWAEHVTALLSRCGWPGDRGLDSTEYQVLREWRRVLEEFVTLQLVDGALTRSAALGRLRQLASGRGFQPESAETPIQIMGFPGAADMAFDHLRILGLDEETWPPAARPNPFLPLSLQRRHGMPRSTAELCLDEARRVLARLLGSVTDVVITYPCNEGERKLRPSPLLRSFGLPGGPTTVAAAPDYPAQILAGARIEMFRDVQAPPLPAGGQAAGGAGLFRDQAACPFRAFARYRLRAATLEEVDIGLNARERGQLAHRLMHLLWQRLGSREQLQTLAASGELESLLENAVEEIVAAGQRRRPRTWTARFTGLEKERLLILARDWLAQEQRRAPFEVIACELDQEITLEGVAVRTRIDRIDRLPGGSEVIIDYKTGRAGVSDWLGERPDDPQLPLYAVTRDADVAGIGFGVLKRGPEFGYRGLARDENVLPDTPAFADSRQARQLAGADALPAWTALLDGWRDTLDGLARRFRDGDARVAPKTPQTCRYCEQHALCRIYEQAIGGSTVGPDEADD